MPAGFSPPAHLHLHALFIPSRTQSGEDLSQVRHWGAASSPEGFQQQNPPQFHTPESSGDDAARSREAREPAPCKASPAPALSSAQDPGSGMQPARPGARGRSFSRARCGCLRCGQRHRHLPPAGAGSGWEAAAPPHCALSPSLSVAPLCRRWDLPKNPQLAPRPSPH